MSAIASTELVRQKNSLSVMAALRLHGSLSHTDISSFTGLASATVSAITMELERAGLILRKEQLAATGYLFGRDPSLADMAIRPFVRQFAGIDEAAWAAAPWPHWMWTERC